MKPFYIIPLLFLPACSTTPKLALRSQQPPLATDNSTVRYPEVVRAYHFGSYVDPNNDLVMHEGHTVFRVEENARWSLRSLRTATMSCPAVDTANIFEPRDAAFSPLPVNDAVLAEVNAQKMATVQIIMQARTLSGALAQFQMALQQTKTNWQEMAAMHATVDQLKHRLEALEAAPNPLVLPPAPQISTTNEPPDPLDP